MKASAVYLIGTHRVSIIGGELAFVDIALYDTNPKSDLLKLFQASQKLETVRTVKKKAKIPNYRDYAAKRYGRAETLDAEAKLHADEPVMKIRLSPRKPPRKPPPRPVIVVRTR